MRACIRVHPCRSLQERHACMQLAHQHACEDCADTIFATACTAEDEVLFLTMMCKYDLVQA